MISETACTLENWIDEYITALQTNSNVVRKNVKSLIKTNRVKPREAKKISDHFRRLLDEVNCVLHNDDEDLAEGWSYLNHTKLKRLQGYLETIVDEFAIAGTIKRKKKKISPDKLVRSLKYLPSFNSMSSVDPIGVIGAKGVLLYNVKQKKISLYESKTGLSIKGSTLQNFDSGDVKSCGRKDTKWLNLLTTCTVMRMKKEINTLRAKTQEPTGRINKDTLILRIIR
tara:strand:- start:21381 stop:22061 length:681 start_codon:yes stop_codon:yes gene_type:complete